MRRHRMIQSAHASLTVVALMLTSVSAFAFDRAWGGQRDRLEIAQAASQEQVQGGSSPAPAAPAAAPAAKPPSAASADGTPAVVVDSQQLESILGRKVRGENGDDMGRIVDVLSDKTGQIRAAIIDFGGFLGVGSRQIAVDWKAIRFSTDPKLDSALVQLSRDQLRVAPVYKAGEQVVVLGQSAPRPAGATTDTAPRDAAPADAAAKEAAPK